MSLHGHFVWYELATRKPDEASAFYRNVAEWGTQQWDGELAYTLLTTGGEDPQVFGGMMTMIEPDFPAEVPSHFMGYIAVEDVDATTQQATGLGATLIHGPADIPDVGRFSIIQDPQGAVITFFRGNQEGDDAGQTYGAISWHELLTTDYEKAFDFYSELLGWIVHQDMDMGGGMVYRLFGPAGSETSIGGMFTIQPGMQAPPSWLYYFHVPDINAGVKAVQDNGGTILNGPMEVPGGDMIVQCMDPEGTAFALHASGQQSS